MLLAVSGVPPWVEQGPAPITNGQVALPPVNAGDPNNAVTGAITSIAAGTGNTLFVGTVGGGVWRTNNSNAATPTWTQLTDQHPSLAITAITVDPVNTNIVWAGTGRASSSAMGGKTVGLLKSIDGGSTWRVMDANLGKRGRTVHAIVTTQLPQGRPGQPAPGPDDRVVLVASDATSFGNGPNQLGGGLLRSTDGGNGRFDKISGNANDGLDNDKDGTKDEADEDTGLPGGTVTDLKADPNNTNFFYAAVAGQGVFFSIDGGRNWQAVNTGLTNIAAAARIELAVGATRDTGTLRSPVYAALLTPIADALTGPGVVGNTITVAEDAPFEVGDAVTISPGTLTADTRTITRIQRSQLVGGVRRTVVTLNAAPTNPHSVPEPVSVGGKASRTLAAASAGTTQVVVQSAARFAVGDVVTIQGGGDTDTSTVRRVIHGGAGASTLVLSSPLGSGYNPGAFVTAPSVSRLRLRRVYRSANLPNASPSWTPMQLTVSNDQVDFDVDGDGIVAPATGDVVRQTFGLNPGGQGTNHFSITADPGNANVVFVGGDVQPTITQANLNGNLSITDTNVFPGIDEVYNSAGLFGGTQWPGRIFRGDASAANHWQQHVGSSVNNTAPHADSRAMAFFNGNLFEAGDGGITRFNFAANRWESANGNVGLTEFYSVAYDTDNNVIVGGAQDVGTAIQGAPPPPPPNPWNTPSLAGGALAQGDGGIVGVGVVTGAADRIFYSNQRLGGFTVSTAGGLAAPALRVAGTALNLVQYDRFGLQFIQPFVVNAIPAAGAAAATALLFGTASLYESTSPPPGNPGDALTLLGARGGAANPAPGASPPAAADIGRVNAMVYGGTDNTGTAQPTLILAGSNGSRNNRHQLYIRQPTAAALTPVQPVVTWRRNINRPVRSIAVDPNDWERIFVLDDLNRVWFTDDGNANPATATGAGAWQWTQLTGNLAATPGAQNLQKVAVFTPPGGGGATTVLVGGDGGIFRRVGVTADEPWAEYGSGMPNALVSDIDYIPATDTLLVGTMGRGAWTVANASTTLGTPGTLTLNGTAANDRIKVERDPLRPFIVNVFQHTVGTVEPFLPTETAPLASLQSIVINGGVGADQIVISSRNGPIWVPGGITVTGDGADTLQLRRPDAASPLKHTSVTGALGGASGTNRTTGPDAFGDTGTQRVTWTNISPPVQVAEVTPGPGLAAEIDILGGGLAATSDAVQNGFAEVLRGVTIAGIDAQSLAAGLNGVQVNPIRPKDNPFFNVSQVHPEALAQIDNATSILRRLIEDGVGGFDFDEVASDGLLPTAAALEEALEALDDVPGNVSLDTTTDRPGDADSLPDTTFNVRIAKRLGGMVDLDVAASVLGGVASVDLTGVIEMEAKVDMHLVFGVDANGFFVLPGGPNDPVVRLSDFNIKGDASGGGRLGFIGVDLKQASLSVDPDVKIDFVLGDPAIDAADALIRMPELAPTDPRSLMGLDVQGDPADATADVRINGTFAVSAVLPGVTGGLTLAEGSVELRWNDLEQPTTVSVSVPVGSAGEKLLDFLDLLPGDVLGRMGDVEDRLSQMVQSSVMNFELPFAPGTTLGGIADAAAAFGQRIMSLLETAPGSGVPAFDTVQEFLALLISSGGIDLLANAASYDQATGELKFHFPINHTFDPISVPIHLSAAGAVGFDLDQVNAVLTGRVLLDLTTGFDLTSAQPASTFFVRVDQLGGGVRAEVAGIGGTAGLLDFTLQNGALVLDAGATITPTQTGSLSLSQLQQALTSAQTVLTTEALAAGNVTAFLGAEGGPGVQVSNASFALGFFNTWNTSKTPAQQAPSTFALDVRGTASLVGLEDVIELSGMISARVNTTGGAVNEPNIGGSGVSLVFSQAEGNARSAAVRGNLTVSDFISLSGDLAFELQGQEIQVTPVGGVPKTVTVLKAGGSNIHAFAGVNGPFWRDSNGDGVINEADTPDAASAVGVAMSGVTFALALFEPTAASDTKRYYALKASAGSTQLVGVPGAALPPIGAAVSVNGVLDTAAPLDTTVPALDLSRSPVVVPTGPTTSLTLDFNNKLLSVSVTVLEADPLTIGNVELSGTLTGTVTGGASTWRLDDFDGEVGDLVTLSGDDAVLLLQPGSPSDPLLTVGEASATFGMLDDDLTFRATGLTLRRNGTFEFTSASLSGDNLLGLGDFLPLTLNSISVGGIGNQPAKFDAFRLTVAGQFAQTLFQNDLADPVIKFGQLTVDDGASFSFGVELQNGAVNLLDGSGPQATLLNGPLTVGFEHMDFGAFEVDATVSFGQFVNGVYEFSLLGLSGKVRKGQGADDVEFDDDTPQNGGVSEIGFSGNGAIVAEGANTRLEIRNATINTSFDTGSAGTAQLRVENLSATFDLQWVLSPSFQFVRSSVDFVGAAADEVFIRFGPEGDELLLFTATGAQFHFRDSTRPWMEFGSVTASLPALQNFLLGPGGTPMTGTVSNFAIGRDFEFIRRPGFGILFQNIPGPDKFGLPSWIPFRLNSIGFQFGDGAGEGPITPEALADLILIVSAGVNTDENVLPIRFTAEVSDLRVNLGALADLVDGGATPGAKDLLNAVTFTGFSIGIEGLKIGEALEIGGKFGLRMIQDNNGDNALVITIGGTFAMAGIGGGVELTVSEVGPIMARLDVPLGIPLGPTGLLMEGVSGGFRFGGSAFSPPATPKELLTQQTTFNPLHFDPSQLDNEIRRLLALGQPTWTQAFTLALAGSVTTVATPGILSGNLNLAAQVRPVPAGQVPDVSFLGSGDVSAFGIQLGSAGAILDFTNPLAPSFDLAFAVPAPTNPLGFLFPVNAQFELRLRTDGLIEAPLIGINHFVRGAVSGATDLLLGRIADAVNTDRDRPFAVRLLAGTNPPTVVDKAFVRSRLDALLPDTISELNAMAAQVNDRANLASAFLVEIFDIARTLTAAERDQVLAQFKDVLSDKAAEALSLGWQRFNPGFEATGFIQPVIVGIPFGPAQRGSILINKDGFGLSFQTSLTEVGKTIADRVFPFGGAMATLMSLGFADLINVSARLEGVPNLFSNLVGGGAFPSLGTEPNFSASFSGALTWFGFPLGTISGAVFTRNSPALVDGPVFQIMQPGEAPVATLIPIAEEDLPTLRNFGGMIITGQLTAPKLLTDPVALIGEIDFAQRPNEQLPAYLQRIKDELLTADELARMQLYIPSFESLFDVTISPNGGAVFSSVAANATQLMNAAYFKGFVDGKLLGMQLVAATLEATSDGLEATLELPWLLGTTATLTIGRRPLNMNDLVERLAAAAGITINLDSVAQLVLEVPVAAAVLELDSREVNKMIATGLGLPPQTFATNDDGLTASLAIFSPGFGLPQDPDDPIDEDTPLVEINGGVQFDGRLNIAGFIEDAEAHFTMPLFTGSVTPDFTAELSISKLAFPGFGVVDGDLFRAGGRLFMEKRNFQVTMEADATLRILNLLTLNVDGNLTVVTSLTDPGVHGRITLSIAGGGDPEIANGIFSLSGTFQLEINTTNGSPGTLPDGPYLGVHVDGHLSILDVLELGATADLTINDQGLQFDGTADFTVDTDLVDFSESASISLTLLPDGRVKGSFEGLGLSASLNRFGLFQSSLIDDEGNVTRLPDLLLPLLAEIPFINIYADDQHVLIDNQRFQETDEPNDPNNPNDGAKTRNIEVKLTREAAENLTLHYTITRDTADPADLAGALSGSITIPKGKSKGTIPVQIVGDDDAEGPETFVVRITGASYPDDTNPDPPIILPVPPGTEQRPLTPPTDWNAVITITDDDSVAAPPVIVNFRVSGLTGSAVTEEGETVFVGSLLEGNTGSVELSAPALAASDSVAIRYTVVPRPRALLNATVVEDFVLRHGGQGFEGVVTLVGSSPKTIDIRTFGDPTYELNEGFDVQFEIVRDSARAPVTLLTLHGLRGTITNNDQDQPPGSMVFYDFDAFTGGHRFTGSAKYVDPLLNAGPFRHVDDAGANFALRFDGIHDHLFAFTADARFALPAGPISIDFWMRPESLARQTVLSLGGGALAVFLESRFVRYRLTNADGAVVTATLGTYTTNAWQHVALVYNGGPGAPLGSTVSGYVGGLGGHRRAVSSATGAIRYGGQSLVVGADHTRLAENYLGSLDEVRVWTTAFTPEQVATLPGLSTTGAEPTLLINYRMDEGRFATAANLTGRTWNAQLGNVAGIFGPFARPDWIEAGDSPVARLSRYTPVSGGATGVPKIPPVSPTADPSFGITSSRWSPVGTPIEQAKFYTTTVGRDAPTDSAGFISIRDMLAIRFDGVDFFDQAQAGGPTRWELRASHDGFKTVLAEGPTDPGGDFKHQRVIFEESIRLIHPTVAVEFRLYGLDAAGNGFWRVDNFALIMGVEVPGTFNRPPLRPPIIVSAPIGAVSTIDVIGGTTDPDLDPVDVIDFTAPAGAGTLVRVGNLFQFTPADGLTGDVPLRFTIADRWGATVDTTVTAHLVGNAINDAFTMPEDTPLVGNVRTNDRLLPGQAATVTPVGTLPASVVLRSDGSFTFVPPLNSTVTVLFNYRLTGPDWTDTATARITITPVNDVPPAPPRTFTGPEDQPIVVNLPGLLAGLVDPEGDPLTAVLVKAPSKGVFTFNANGTFTYVPKSQDDSFDTFTYAIFDGKDRGKEGTATLDLTPVDDPPTGLKDEYEVDAGKTLTVAAPGFLANDSDLEGSALSAVLVTGVSHGTLTFNSNGSFSYVPATGFTGSDGFFYRPRAGGVNGTDAVSVAITVRPPNQPPFASNDTLSVQEDSSVNFTPAGLLINDSDPETGPLTVTALGNPTRGTLTVNGPLSSGTTTITYRPNANVFGSDSFTYTISDNRGLTATATVNVGIFAVNDAPVAGNNSFSIDRKNATQLVVSAPGVLLNDTDIDGNSLTAVLATNPANGTLTFNSNGSFTYVPQANFRGTDTFTYRARDVGTPSLTSALASVSITVFDSTIDPVTPVIVTTFGGYVSYGRVGLDVNFNNLWDFDDRNSNGRRDVGEDAEPVGDMGVGGVATLNLVPALDLNRDGSINPSEGVLLGFSGVVSATLQPMWVPFTAPVGSAVITPHTTLLTALVRERALTVAAAHALLAQAFALGRVDLMQFDPIAATAAGNAAGPAVLASHVRLHDTYAQISTFVAAAAKLPLHQAAAAVMSALAAQVAGGGTLPLDLDNAGRLGTIVQNALTRVGGRASAADVIAIASVIAAGNQAVTAVAPSADQEYVDSVYAVEGAAQGAVLAAIQDFAGGAITRQALIAGTTGGELTRLIAAAPRGMTLPPSGGRARLANVAITPANEGGAARLTGTLVGRPAGSAASIRISWGDGTSQTFAIPAAVASFTVDHTYADDRPTGTASDAVPVAVMLLINGAGADVASARATVANLPPTLEGVTHTSAVLAGTAAGVNGILSDVGDTLGMRIDWGDGSVDTPTVAADGKFGAAHAYAAPGRYTVTLRGTDDDGGAVEHLMTIDVASAAGPRVDRLVVDDGSTQRSMVRSLTLVFDQPVTLNPALLTLRRNDGAEYALTAANPSGDGKTFLLAFAGPGITGASLPDGRYELRVAEGAALNALAASMAGDFNGRFHRFFGDSDGDADVDWTDYLRFRRAVNSRLFSSRYVPHFDFDADGDVDGADAAGILARRFRSI